MHRVAEVLTPDAGFEGVLHFAGKIEVAESVARPDLYWDVNVVRHDRGAERDPRGRHAAADLLLDRVDVRLGRRRTVGKLAEDAAGPPGQPLRRDQAARST